MKKKLTRTIAAFAVLAVIAAIGIFSVNQKITEGCSKNGSTVQHTSKSKASPRLKIGINPIEPFCYMGSDGKLIGIDIDLAREVCKRIGVTPVFIDVAWDQRDDYLANGKIDCVWSAFAINGRKDSYRWTTAYLDTPLAMIVNDGDPSRSISDFHGPSGIAVRSDSVAESFLLDGGFAKLSGNTDAVKVNSYGTTDMAETSFAKGLSDALVTYKLALDRFISDQSELATYRYINDDLTMLHLGVAFPKGSTSPYIEKLDTVIQEMKDDGTIDATVKKYKASTTKGADNAQ